jgi:VWFA-related protein
MPPLFAQQAFRSDVRTVPVYATVVDGAGNVVTGLTANDFKITDNGRTAPVTVFVNDIQSVSVAVLLDTSPSVMAEFDRAQSAVIELAKRLLPDDHATVGVFSHVVTLDPELTSSTSTLIQRLGASAPFPAGTAIWDALDAGRAAVTMQSGRRVVLIVTDADDNCSRLEADIARSRLEREGVAVYGLGVRGRDGLQSGELGALVRLTGGGYMELRPADSAATVMGRIADELHQQYLLGFTPATLDDKLHRLSVKTTKPGVSVRARGSYLAASHDPIR